MWAWENSLWRAWGQNQLSEQADEYIETQVHACSMCKISIKHGF